MLRIPFFSLEWGGGFALPHESFCKVNIFELNFSLEAVFLHKSAQKILYSKQSVTLFLKLYASNDGEYIFRTNDERTTGCSTYSVSMMFQVIIRNTCSRVKIFSFD